MRESFVAERSVASEAPLCKECQRIDWRRRKRERRGVFALGGGVSA